jgi:hypothetical protein
LLPGVSIAEAFSASRGAHAAYSAAEKPLTCSPCAFALIDFSEGFAILGRATGNRIPSFCGNPRFDSGHAEKALA